MAARIEAVYLLHNEPYLGQPHFPQASEGHP